MPRDKGSITLHPKLGLNPRLCRCPNCGQDNGEIALAGVANKMFRCTSCDNRILAAKASRITRCPRGCENPTFEFVRELDEREKVLGSLCKACEEKQKAEGDEHRKVVVAGGIYFQCSDCHARGVIKDSPLAAAVRKTAGIDPPKPVGVEFSKKDCPACGPNKIT